MKIIDKINAYLNDTQDGGSSPAAAQTKAPKKPFFSFEYFPPKTDAGVQNLYERIDRMAAYDPMWIDVTWGAGGSTSDLTLEICSTAQNFTGVETMMHLTCTNMPVDKLRSALLQAKESGIQNILALRGDAPRGLQTWEQCEGGFAYAEDLVKFIKAEFGDFFGIAVAGYPECHLESKSKEEDLKHLKAKVDAGADLIITQLFYDVDEFLRFVSDCRDMGITCPILPGIMPIQSYTGFSRMTSFCKTKVPQPVLDALEPIKDDDEAVKSYGVELAIQMSRQLLANGALGIHLYTLNLEKSCSRIIEGLQLGQPDQRRALPWKKSARADRAKEDVRPIFWANRPKSYIARTQSWDEFPNGRWGDARSAAFGDVTHYPSMSKGSGKSVEERLELWGVPSSSQDIYDIFVKYVEGSLTLLPWCENDIQNETSIISYPLVQLNKHGYLTINSQPRVNAASSDDPVVGWGPKNGYVYQKAYVEFFCSPSKLEAILQHASQHPSLTYQAVNRKGEVYANTTEGKVNAVTWGVFPNKEIVQPTVVEPNSFMVWKTEAFYLWDEWAEIYAENSAPRQLIKEIQDTYYLVNIVDNDYVHGDLFRVFGNLNLNDAQHANHAASSAK